MWAAVGMWRGGQTRAQSSHQLSTACCFPTVGTAAALRPKQIKGRSGASSLTKYVSNSLSFDNSCVRMSALKSLTHISWHQVANTSRTHDHSNIFPTFKVSKGDGVTCSHGAPRRGDPRSSSRGGRSRSSLGSSAPSEARRVPLEAALVGRALGRLRPGRARHNHTPTLLASLPRARAALARPGAQRSQRGPGALPSNALLCTRAKALVPPVWAPCWRLESCLEPPRRGGILKAHAHNEVYPCVALT